MVYRYSETDLACLVVIPETDSISNCVAWRIAFTEPNFLISNRLLFGPIPGTESKGDFRLAFDLR